MRGRGERENDDEKRPIFCGYEFKGKKRWVWLVVGCLVCVCVRPYARTSAKWSCRNPESNWWQLCGALAPPQCTHQSNNHMNEQIKMWRPLSAANKISNHQISHDSSSWICTAYCPPSRRPTFQIYQEHGYSLGAYWELDITLRSRAEQNCPTANVRRRRFKHDKTQIPGWLYIDHKAIQR